MLSLSQCSCWPLFTALFSFRFVYMYISFICLIILFCVCVYMYNYCQFIVSNVKKLSVNKKCWIASIGLIFTMSNSSNWHFKSFLICWLYFVPCWASFYLCFTLIVQNLFKQIPNILENVRAFPIRKKKFEILLRPFNCFRCGSSWAFGKSTGLGRKFVVVFFLGKLLMSCHTEIQCIFNCSQWKLLCKMWIRCILFDFVYFDFGAISLPREKTKNKLQINWIIKIVV